MKKIVSKLGYSLNFFKKGHFTITVLITATNGGEFSIELFFSITIFFLGKKRLLEGIEGAPIFLFPELYQGILGLWRVWRVINLVAEVG